MASRPLHIREEQDKGFDILYLKGVIDLLNCSQLEERLATAAQGEQPQIIIDFTEITFISSPGFGILIKYLNLVNKQGGQIFLVGLQASIKYLFDKLGIADSFRYAKTVKAALKEDA